MDIMFSIVIPTYEYSGKACEILETCLKSIEQQTFTDYEIVIVDHSNDNKIEEYLKTWNLNIHYYKNERGRGNSSINMNEGIKKAQGKFIKIMHMDDWFYNKDALLILDRHLKDNPQKFWGGFGFNHFYQEESIITRFIRPHINSDLQTLLGCPSVSFFINNIEDPIFFDENLIIINDSDMHIRLGKKYGDPLLIDDFCITIRMHSMQVSNNVSDERHRWELNYYRSKNINGK